MKLHYQDNKLRLAFDYSEELVILSKSLSGRWNKLERCWTFHPSQIVKIIEVFNLQEDDLTITAKALLDGAKILAERREELRTIKSEKKKIVLELPKDFSFITEPFDHQKQSLAAAMQFNTFALLEEVGCGKTKVAIDLFRLRYKLGQVKKMMVICPKSVIGVWENEVVKHSLIKPEDIFILQSITKKSKKSREDLFVDFLNSKKMKIALFGYEFCLHFDIKNCIITNPEIAKSCLLVLDESTRIKNPSAKRTKIILSICKDIPYRIIMSGVLIPNNLLDCWSQWQVIDQGESLGTTFTGFKNNYFFSDKFGFNYYPKSGTKDFISKVIDSQSYRVRKEECLDLPPKIYETRNIDMTESQGRIYREIAETMIAQIEADRVVCSVALTRLIKLAEITSGFVISNEGKVLNLENPKLDALMEILDEIEGHKALIFAIHHHSIEHIIEAINTRNNQSKNCCVALYGKTSSNAKDIVNMFQTDEKCRYLVAHPLSGGVGVTLTQASYVIYFSNDFNFENRIQSEARAHRAGSEIHSKITYIDLVCRNSIDLAILKSLKSKKKIQESIVDFRKLIKGEYNAR